jgi:hypothetical protein
MLIGKHYNFKHQHETLVYMGKEGYWNQFELVDNPGEVWCEVHDRDLHMIEEIEQQKDNNNE